MVIAVYADFRLYESSDMDLYFVKSLINNCTSALTEHMFHLLTPGVVQGLGNNGLSIIPLNLKSGFLYRYRLNGAVARAAKEIKADVLVSIDTVFTTAYPQLLVLSSSKMKKQLPLKSLQKAKTILVPSATVRSGLADPQKINPEKIKLLYGGPSQFFIPLSDENRSLIKERYTGGNEYFIYRGTLTKANNIIPLLKAFSFFKKRQKSAMKMVLLGTLVWPRNEFEKLLNTYKYREDVVVVNNATEQEEAQLVASAYAYIQTYAGENLSFVFDAMQCAVPVLMNADSPLKKMDLDAAVYFESSNDNDIAHKMMWMYKDETLRSQLIGKGDDFIREYSWKKTVEVLDQCLRS